MELHEVLWVIWIVCAIPVFLWLLTDPDEPVDIDDDGDDTK
jgi:hypothetical protein